MRLVNLVLHFRLYRGVCCSGHRSSVTSFTICLSQSGFFHTLGSLSQSYSPCLPSSSLHSSSFSSQCLFLCPTSPSLIPQTPHFTLSLLAQAFPVLRTSHHLLLLFMQSLSLTLASLIHPLPLAFSIPTGSCTNLSPWVHHPISVSPYPPGFCPSSFPQPVPVHPLHPGSWSHLSPLIPPNLLPYA